MKRFLFWLVKTFRNNASCSKFCVTCEYFEICKQDMRYEFKRLNF